MLIDLKACDDVLQSVEKYLSSFQTDLGAVSAEIETLQSRSTALNEKLENRQRVEKLLGPVVDRIALSPKLVKKISDGPIDDAWVQALNELQQRSTALESATDLKDIHAVGDLKPLIEDLTNKVSLSRVIEKSPSTDLLGHGTYKRLFCGPNQIFEIS